MPLFRQSQLRLRKGLQKAAAGPQVGELRLVRPLHSRLSSAPRQLWKLHRRWLPPTVKPAQLSFRSDIHDGVEEQRLLRRDSLLPRPLRTSGDHAVQDLLSGSQDSFMVPFFQCGTCCGKRNQPSATSPTGDRSLSTASWMFSLRDLKSATNDFNSEAKLGQGGFGTVYKGTLQDGREIAAKKLSVGSPQGKQEFLNEVRLLTTVHHRNLIKLYGCCVEESERILVYEYLRHRSLDKHLFDPVDGTKLNWDMRRSIILGTAKGLSYLHEYSRFPMVHRDIKPGNILLDDHFLPKIADFGLAKLFTDDQTHISAQETAGTLGYLAPEYAYHGKLSKKVDVFSFGVVILEVISGRRNGQELLLDLAWRLHETDNLLELLDSRLLTNDQNASSLAKEVVQMGRVALLCTQAEPSLRPPMSNVVLLLSGKSSIKQVIKRPAFVGVSLVSSMAGSSSSGGSSSTGTGASVVGNLQRVSASHMHQQGGLAKGSSNLTYDWTGVHPR